MLGRSVGAGTAAGARPSFLDDAGLRQWLLLLPGTIWMAVFVGVPVGSIILFSFWKSGFAGLVPVYNVKNYVNLPIESDLLEHHAVDLRGGIDYARRGDRCLPIRPPTASGA